MNDQGLWDMNLELGFELRISKRESGRKVEMVEQDEYPFRKEMLEFS